MLKKKSGLITRRSLLKSSAAAGAALVSGVGGVSTVQCHWRPSREWRTRPMFWRGSMSENT